MSLRIGIAGTGGIGLASAAWLAQAGHAVTVWSPGGQGALALRDGPLRASGAFDAEVRVAVAADAAALAHRADVLIVALPVNGHRTVMDRLLPHLRDGQTVIVSSMASLSSLYLHEAARRRGLDLAIASLGTTVLTARRSGANEVRVLTRRSELGLSALPGRRLPELLALARSLFGEVFVPEHNALASALVNINPVAHGPLALFNWTRIERAENWPQYHFMTPMVAAAIERLDAERIALARAFGVAVRGIEEHFAKSFGTTAPTLAAIAAELHAKRGGPPGPTDTGTRFLAEDVPFGLVFNTVLGDIAGLAMPATRSIIAAAELILGRDLKADNDLIEPLALREGGVARLLDRVS